MLCMEIGEDTPAKMWNVIKIWQKVSYILHTNSKTVNQAIPAQFSILSGRKALHTVLIKWRFWHDDNASVWADLYPVINIWHNQNMA